MLYLRLFYEFAKAGLFAVGGGLATLPFLTAMSEKTGWFTAEQLADMVAVSESTPGPIGVNMATYVGYNTAGILGSIIATLGLIFPSLIIIIIISKILSKFKDNKQIKDAFYGLRPASTALIAAAGIGFLDLAIFDKELFAVTGSIIDLINIKAFIMAGIIFVAIRKTKIHPIAFIILSAIIGVIFKF